MVYVYDEHIIAATYCLKGWKNFSNSFLVSAYNHGADKLLADGILWVRDFKCKETPAEVLEKKYKGIFKNSGNHILVEVDGEEMYQYLLSGYPEEIQVTLANFIQYMCS